MALAVADYSLEFFCWMWCYSRFHVQVRDGLGVGIYLSGHAGMFLPAQTGRLIRPEAVSRLGRGNLANGVKAEVILFILDAMAALVILSGLIFLWIKPVLLPFVALGSSLLFLFFADRFFSLFSGMRFSLPTGFWRSRQTFAMLWLLVGGWVLNGLVLYSLIWKLGKSISPWETIFYATSSRMLGAGTGLPGGIGVIESLLGVSLQIMDIPTAHLALIVGAYRLVAFWSLLPIGWLALLILNIRPVKTKG
jgi:uncharacterized membrane protein YbhN (UPF0104 family)